MHRMPRPAGPSTRIAGDSDASRAPFGRMYDPRATMARMTLQDVLDFGAPEAAGSFGELAAGIVRTPLPFGAWVDVAPRWLRAGDELFETLAGTVPWQAERRQMYDNVVDVPRLTKFYGADETWPHPLLREACEALSAHYLPTLDEPLVTAGLCLYRDGRDSVAWHGDRIGRSRYQDTIVAILSLGATRTLALRPRGGGASMRFVTGHGDLIVMGGSCQRTWEHAIPKVAESVGPRMSIQFRPAGVR